MFTGIIEDLGTVGNLTSIDGGIRFEIAARDVIGDLKIGDSISVNGVCLTVVQLSGSRFAVEAVGETLEKTTLGSLKSGARVNLERAMAGSGRFGGHFVQGHVNGTAQVTQWFRRGENYFLEIELPPELLPYVILEGSIAIEGISLTVAVLDGRRAGINIIPHTAKVTNLKYKQPGEQVNVEVDVIAKYVANLLKYPALLNPEEK